ncbi:MAG: nitrogen regulatory protein P-II [Acidobacteria bacterium OLB17]|nr:MAG: nitrogen regulatory protein P-II [Acidobacteria bacterium OLB17]MCZ2391611.1 P-II family nitrogen regulator [Acidobacteriota bacterium]
MKLIIAVVRPFLIDRIVVALEDIEGFPGATFIEARGFGQRLEYSRDDMLNPLHETKQVEIVAPDEMVERIVATISEHAHTGKRGDGIIFVLPLEDVTLI